SRGRSRCPVRTPTPGDTPPRHARFPPMAATGALRLRDHRAARPLGHRRNHPLTRGPPCRERPQAPAARASWRLARTAQSRASPLSRRPGLVVHPPDAPTLILHVLHAVDFLTQLSQALLKLPEAHVLPHVRRRARALRRRW